ncbi:hypothetical protein STEG23_003736, partial [Scotinomys teguina]
MKGISKQSLQSSDLIHLEYVEGSVPSVPSTKAVELTFPPRVSDGPVCCRVLVLNLAVQMTFSENYEDQCFSQSLAVLLETLTPFHGSYEIVEENQPHQFASTQTDLSFLAIVLQRGPACFPHQIERFLLVLFCDGDLIVFPQAANVEALITVTVFEYWDLMRLWRGVSGMKMTADSEALAEACGPHSDCVQEKAQDLSVIEEVIRMMLEIINSCLTNSLHHNPNLVYALLYKRDLFEQFRTHPSFQDIMQNIDLVISFFSSRLLQAGAELSVERVLEIIKQGVVALPKDRLK